MSDGFRTASEHMVFVRDGGRLGAEFRLERKPNHQVLVGVLRAASVLGNEEFTEENLFHKY